jgi:hypothetical protein
MKHSAKQLYKLTEKFNNICVNGKIVNPIPSDVKITVLCDSECGQGFLENVSDKELNRSTLIAKSWILQSDLENLINQK